MTPHERRRSDFAALYDFENDPGVTLAHLVRAAGDFLSEIVGPENADPAMRTAIGALGAGEDLDASWRDLLEDNEHHAFSEWPMGRLLHDLSAYAQYGIDLNAEPGERVEEIETRIAARVAAAERFLARCPLDAWLGADRAHQLERTVAMARCRFALDRGEPVDPVDLAELGNLSHSRMRSLISGKNPELKREDGRIPAAIALPWLERREGFLGSIWRTQVSEMAEATHPVAEENADVLSDPLFVPRAKDGSIFHPGLRTAKGFQIGPKGQERIVNGFREALAALQAMPTPYWRRPSATSGTPGIVRGEEWVRKSADEFDVRIHGEASA